MNTLFSGREFIDRSIVSGSDVPLHRPDLPLHSWLAQRVMREKGAAAERETAWQQSVGAAAGAVCSSDSSDRAEVDASASNPPAAHVAIVMDGNGRWANARGLARTEGHRAGEFSLMDTIAGAVEAGVQVLSVYAFSTENWKRSPSEVKFLLGYSRDVIHRCRERLNEWNVKVLWSGREPKLWKSVIKELREAEALTAGNTGLILNFCMNYGGQAEIVDAVREIAAQAAAGVVKPQHISAATIAQHLYQPELPPVDLFIRSGGEQRTSNFLLWQAAYAEMMFIPEPWPEFSRETLWECLEKFAGRERRFGGAVDRVA